MKASHAGSKYIKTRIPCVKKEHWADDIGVKGRNEPAGIMYISILFYSNFSILLNLLSCFFSLYRQVLEIMSATRNEDLYSLANAMYENTKKLFKF